MKSVPFEYARPETIEEVCHLLMEEESARIIAGGQTLIPMLAMRLARPSYLIDINRVLEMQGIIEKEDNTIWIGAGTRQSYVEKNRVVAEKAPLLSKAIRWVGHPPIRALGTIGGSIASADPAAEIPLAALVSGAVIETCMEDSMEILEVDDFFIAPMVTALPENSCLTGIQFPIAPAGRFGTAFDEISSRKGDFAFVCAAAEILLDDEGRCSHIRFGIGGADDTPVLLEANLLVGKKLDAKLVKDAVVAACESLNPIEDLHASAEYRRRAACTLGTRVIMSANKEAINGRGV